MSHVLDPRAVKEADRLRITNLAAVCQALRNLGFEVLSDVEEQQERGVEPLPNRGRYRGHKTRFGRLVGDYPIPEGWTYADVDNNATVVARMPRETFDRLRASGMIPAYLTFDDMYDLGIVYDARSNCYWPVYDFADGGGRVLQSVLGSVAGGYRGGQVTAACEKLMQAYHMACDELAAQEAGYEFVCFSEGETTPEGYLVKPGERVSYAVIPEGQ